ncbi:MAG TPA: hypothetical protein VK886_00790 [Vicinamibacterales bacterium]|nr:hypothetical protein [Vicinamibacterales bacterium]
MRPFCERPVAVLVAIALLMAATAGLQAARDRWLPRPPVRERLLYLRSGEAIKRAALSFDALAADVYWIRTVQHYGGDRRVAPSQQRYELLYPLLDVTTTLDPSFSIAYRFGAFFLSDAFPSGAGRPDLAVALLRKGLRAEPQKWQYMQDIGFVYYWAVGDYGRAGEWYLRASKVPGAPNWMGLVAAAMVAGDDRQASRFLWRELYQTTESEWIRRAAERNLILLDVMDDLDRINARLRPFVEEMPEDPVTWDRLIRAGALRHIPVDPAGFSYQMNPWWGEATVAPESPLYPLPPIYRGRAGAAR